MNLLLISKTAIIIKIFTLICKKIDIEFHVKSEKTVDEKMDFIIIDQDFIDDDFNSFKPKCSKLGAICSDELPFEKSRDFLIPRPFLPMQLQTILNDEISYLNEEVKIQKNSSSFSNLNIDEKSNINLDIDNRSDYATNYVESLADDIVSNIEEDNDESIVTIPSINEGGVLDNNELNKINQILRQDSIQDDMITQNDWKNLSDIIDDALNEVSDEDLISTCENSAKKLILNKYSIDELRPLLEKFDQKTIDKLSNGETVDLKLSLKENN